MHRHIPNPDFNSRAHMETKRHASKLTLVVGVPGQPFAFGAVGGANDADRVPARHWKVVLANLASHHHLGVVQGLLFARHLESQISVLRGSSLD